LSVNQSCILLRLEESKPTRTHPWRAPPINDLPTCTTKARSAAPREQAKCSTSMDQWKFERDKRKVISGCKFGSCMSRTRQYGGSLAGQRQPTRNIRLRQDLEFMPHPCELPEEQYFICGPRSPRLMEGGVIPLMARKGHMRACQITSYERDTCWIRRMLDLADVIAQLPVVREDGSPFARETILCNDGA
jgi:hypothetical protein